MQTEFEATFLNIDKDEIRKQLKKIGAVLIYPEYLMKRVVFDPPVKIVGGWLRVRQEFDKVTMSFKIVSGNKIEDQKEAMVVIESFASGVEFLKSIGAKQKSYQETKRELWKLDEAEICLDTWPGINSFIEIEAGDEFTVKNVVSKIGFNYSEAFFGEVSYIYEKELGIPAKIMKDEMPEITFENPPQKYV